MKIFDNPNAMLKSKYCSYQIAVLGNIIAVSAEGTASKTAIERYSKDMIESIVKTQFERIYDKAGVKLGIFSDEEHALEWLVTQGFDMQNVTS